MNLTEQQAIQDGLNVFHPDTHFTYSTEQGDLLKRFFLEQYGLANAEITDELIAVFAEDQEYGKFVKYNTFGENEVMFVNELDSMEEKAACLIDNAASFYDYGGGVFGLPLYKR